jgi:hypothetical protein
MPKTSLKKRFVIKRLFFTCFFRIQNAILIICGYVAGAGDNTFREEDAIKGGKGGDRCE